jgi:cytochrome c2
MRSSNRIGAGVVVSVALIAFVGGILVSVEKDATDLQRHAAATTGGDPKRGEAMFIQYGCGSCHEIAHVRKATGMVGPPLDGIAIRAMIAGKLSNKPENMERWISDPQAVTPGTAMPDLHVNGRDARDITAFLYTRD